jgi:hypothetical protein
VRTLFVHHCSQSVVEAGACREPRLLGVESSLHTSQHDVINPSRVAKADNGKALVGEQYSPQSLVGLTFRAAVAVLGIEVDRASKIAQVLFVIGGDPLGDSR